MTITNTKQLAAYLNSAERRFLKFLEQRPDGCLIFKGSHSPEGYGRFHFSGSRISAHAYAYMSAFGPIPPGMTVDHKCFVPACCNPDHLQLLTPSENSKNKQSIGRTTCRRGHVYDDKNTYIKPTNYRYRTRDCRACAAERARGYRSAKKEKRA